MKRAAVYFDCGWHVLHTWHIGLPSFFVALGFVGLLSLTPKSTARTALPPAPGLLESTWEATGLPLKAHPQWGFMGHGGYLLPGVFALSAVFALTWSVLAGIHWWIHWSEEKPDRREVNLAGGLVRQIGWGLIRVSGFSVFAIVFYIVAGNVVVFNMLFWALLFLCLLVTRAAAVALYRFLRNRPKRSEE